MKKLLICMLALALLAGCAPASVQEPEDGKLHIVATVFPAYDFARAAAGDLADVELLLPPGTESHSYEPTPADILKVQSCDLFLYLGGDSDQWVETILEAAEPTGRTLALIDCVETLEEEHVEGMQEEVGHHHDEDEDDHDHDHLGTVTEIDEHVWTAPANAAAITRQFGEVLAELDSANGERYRANAEKYAEEIDTLDGEFHAFFDSLPDRTIVFGDRFPLRYFAEEFDLRYYAAFPGCSTQTEPSAATIAFLTDKVREEGISTVWYIEFSNHLVADAIAEAAGAGTAMFHTCHNVSPNELAGGETYVTLTGLQRFRQIPVLILVQIWEKGVGFRRHMHLCDVSGVAEGQHLPVNAPAADDEAALSGAGKRRRIFGAAADGKAGKRRHASAQRHIDPPRKGLFSREILDGAPPRDHHCPTGGCPEEFPVG